MATYLNNKVELNQRDYNKQDGPVSNNNLDKSLFVKALLRMLFAMIAAHKSLLHNAADSEPGGHIVSNYQVPVTHYNFN